MSRIKWYTNENVAEALADSKASRRPLLVDFWDPHCLGCAKLFAATYPDASVQALLESSFVCLKYNTKQVNEWFKKLSGSSAHLWTPDVFIVDDGLTQLRRWFGYIQPSPFVAQLQMGLGLWHLRHGRIAEAQARFDSVALAAEGSAAAEALYWGGVAAYSTSGLAGLTAQWELLQKRYPESEWAGRSDCLDVVIPSGGFRMDDSSSVGIRTGADMVLTSQSRENRRAHFGRRPTGWGFLLKPFETERYLGRFEFSQPYLLAASDCETVSIAELVSLGGGSLEALANIKLGYSTLEGSEPLRQSITTLYTTVQADQVLVLSAPIEGIYATMRTLISAGEHVVVLAPAYDALLNVPEEMTGYVSRWHLRMEGQSWRLDLTELERLLAKSARLLAINFPHNPTGFTPTRDELDTIIRLCRTYHVTLFSDEIYRGLEYQPSDALPSVADLDETAITLQGASKSLGLPGLRLGWLTIKDQSRYRDILNTKTYTSMCSTQASEYLGVMALKAAPRLVSSKFGDHRQQHDTCGRFLQKMGNAPAVASAKGRHCVARRNIGWLRRSVLPPPCHGAWHRFVALAIHGMSWRVCADRTWPKEP